jgi:hypothetical protein
MRRTRPRESRAGAAIKKDEIALIRLRPDAPAPYVRSGSADR